jgi:hypothetical protein
MKFVVSLLLEVLLLNWSIAWLISRNFWSQVTAFWESVTAKAGESRLEVTIVKAFMVWWVCYYGAVDVNS